MGRISSLASTSAVALGLIAATPVLAADLIIDGGFENPIVTTPGQFQSGNTTYAVGSSFGGPSNNAWTVVGVGNGVTVTSTTEYTGPSGSPTYYNGHSGLQWLDLSGYDDNAERVGVSQTVATSAGSAYTLSLWLGTFNDATSSIEIDIDGTLAGTFSNPTAGNSPGDGLNYAQYILPVIAAGPSTTISILQTGGKSAVGLDDVSFTTVDSPAPEPATWAMFLGGFGAVGGMLRSRRRTSVAFA